MDKKLLQLDPQFQPIVSKILDALTAKGWQPIIAEGKRTVEQQREKVKMGYSQTMKSYHLTGLAVDIIDKRYAWNIPLHHKFWYDLGHIVKDMKLQKGYLRWGGVWSVPERWTKVEQAQKNQSDKGLNWFMDVAHVELRI
jgi:hypothetical protein